jgi:N-acetylglucosamine-6-sulfatase
MAIEHGARFRSTRRGHSTRMRPKTPRFVAGGLAAAAVALAASAGGTTAHSAARAPALRPNIVFVLTDDLSWNLVPYMPHVRQMQRRGTTFSNYVVTDSLCCPSRASIFTGRYPHDTGIFTNGGEDGGFHLFHSRLEEHQTFATRLHARGYLTALMGKYLNGYEPLGAVDGKVAYVPPGWDEWDVAGDGYLEFKYALNENGMVAGYPAGVGDYLTDVLARKAVDFVDRAAAARRPFLLEVATFAPHSPYTPAPRDSRRFRGLRAPRPPAFDEADVSDKPAWVRTRQPLDDADVAAIDTAFRRRAQAVRAVDRLIAKLQARLAHDRVARRTYVFFSSDNGLHLGEHRLLPGKQTAFETDIRVPLIVTGPGVGRAKRVTRVAQNVDLYPTFARLAGASVPASVDGRSLVPLLRTRAVRSWRDLALVEHHGPNLDRTDPDAAAPGSGNPPTYAALRLPQAVYVEYAGGGREYYDLRTDPQELDNVASGLPESRLASLHSALVALQECHGAASCAAAEQLQASARPTSP